MRPDIDPKKLTAYHAMCLTGFQHPKAFGGVVEAADYDGYRHEEKDGGTFRWFIATRSGDISADWLDVTDYLDNFNFIPKTDQFLDKA